MDFGLGMLGVAGGILCAIADLLFDKKPRGNIKMGKYKLIDSGWANMSMWRFKWSIIIAAVGVPLYFLGFIAMKNQLAQSNQFLANLFFLFAIIGTTGGMFIHATLCYLPMISKTAENAVVTERIINKIYDAILIPFLAQYTFLVIGTTGIVIYAIITGLLPVPKVFVFLNSLGFLIVSLVLRLFKKDLETPGVSSMGLAMIGLMAALNSVL